MQESRGISPSLSRKSSRQDEANRIGEPVRAWLSQVTARAWVPHHAWLAFKPRHLKTLAIRPPRPALSLTVSWAALLDPPTSSPGIPSTRSKSACSSLATPTEAPGTASRGFGEKRACEVSCLTCPCPCCVPLRIAVVRGRAMCLWALLSLDIPYTAARVFVPCASCLSHSCSMLRCLDSPFDCAASFWMQPCTEGLSHPWWEGQRRRPSTT